MPETREEIYRSIDIGRIEQLMDSRETKPVEDYLLAIVESHSDFLMEVVSRRPLPGQREVYLRDLAALCVGCMEDNGGWDRKPDGAFANFVVGTLPRNLVFHKISTELDYHTMTSDPIGRDLSIKGFGIMLYEYIDQAVKAFALNESVMQPILKIAALSCRCMARAGIPVETVSTQAEDRMHRVGQPPQIHEVGVLPKEEG